MKTYIIIGASAAGYGAALTLTRLDLQAHILCITKEAVPYNTCLLTHYLITGQNIELAFNGSQVQLLTNTLVQGIGTYNKHIILSSGDTLSYDALLIATGSKARSYPHAHMKGIFTFYTLGDVQAMKEYVQQHKVSSAVVVGAGFTGIECADALARLGIKIWLVEQKKHIVSCMGPENSAHIVRILSEQDITVITEDSVRALEEEGGQVTGVQLHSCAIRTSLVVYAQGSAPSIDLAVQADIGCSQAIKTDRYMKTTASSVYVAGDCALVYDRLSQSFVPNTTWSDAVRQGMVAAHNMVGSSLLYEGRIRNYRSSVGGVPIIVFGLSTPHAFHKVLDDGYYTFFFTDDEHFVGFTCVGGQTQVPLLKKAVEENKRLQDLI